MDAIRLWRNAQLDILRQKSPLSPEDQSRYFRDVVLPSQAAEEPSIVLGAYLVSGEHVGYGGLVHIDWQAKRAEVSFLVEPSRTRDPSVYASDFEGFLALLQHLAFRELGFHRLFTETFDIRETHVSVLTKVGFRFEGRLRHHVKIGSSWVDSLMHGKLATEYFDER